MAEWVIKGLKNWGLILAMSEGLSILVQFGTVYNLPFEHPSWGAVKCATQI